MGRSHTLGVEQGPLLEGETRWHLPGPPGSAGCSLTRVAFPRIVCATGPAPGAFSDVVTVNASKEGRSRERFSYVVREAAAYPLPTLPGSPRAGLRPDRLPSSPQLPLVHSLEPAVGPKAGGTRITIHGSDLHVGSELQVLVNDTEPCMELV